MSDENTISSHTLIRCQHCGKITNAKDDPAWRNMEEWLAKVTAERDVLAERLRLQQLAPAPEHMSHLRKPL